MSTKDSKPCDYQVEKVKELFECDLCGKKMNYKRNLYEHKKKIHTDSCEMSECNICSQLFKRPRDLRKHMEIHGPKLYWCKLCRAQFHQKSNCDHHEKRCSLPL